MATSALASTVITGVAVLVVLAVVLRLRRWQHPAASVEAGPGGLVDRVNGPAGWSVAFVIAALGVMALGVLYAQGTPVAGLDQAALGLLVGVVLLAVFGLAGLAAVYAAIRGRGLNSAQAAAVSSTLLGLLLLAAIVVQLFVGG